MNAPPPDRWQQLDALFAEALARPPDERTAFLRATCGHDPALYAEVLALLEDTDAAERALGESVADYAAPLLPGLRSALEGGGASGELAPGTALGPYRVRGLLGRGGMGTVYLAERADGAFQKRVALKVVRRGLDTDDVLARFRRERQLLAALDHPHIARLLDGGATDDGRPFLVLEHVEGEPLTAYSDRNHLTVDARLALFAQVGEAVQHAHRRLVVHRDLKPSNVLVREDESGAPQVKLLDFGVAKLLDPDAPDEGAHTRPGLRLLTPEYAAPEQLRGEAVTTAADVYALGVLLYELLAGCRPARAATPEPPGARVTAAVAHARATTVERLRRRLRGDLDTICLKALREEPDRRYPSAEALLEDLRRHREGLPVRARPETPAYRAWKFVRRHRAGVGAAAAFVALLVGALVAVSLQQRATARERDRAEAERVKAEETAAFLESLFAASDPFDEERLDTLRVPDLLDRGTARLRHELAGQPLVRAQLLHVIGRTHAHLGLYAEAEPLLREALHLRRAHLGDAHLDVAETLVELAQVVRERDQHAAGEPLLREALAIRQAALGDRHPLVAQTMASLAVAAGRLGDVEEQGRLLSQALAIQQATLAPTDPALIHTMTRLASRHLALGQYAEAAAVHRDVVARTRRRYGSAHPGVSEALRKLAFVLQAAGRPEESEAVVREALAIDRAAFGDSSYYVRDGLNMLGGVLRAQGRLDEAEAALRGALPTRVRNAGDHAVTLGALASVLLAKGDAEAAEQAQREALGIVLQRYGEAHPVVATSRIKLAAILRERRRFEEAEGLLLAEVEAAGGARGGEGSAHARGARQELITLYESWGRPEAASRYRPAVAPRH